MKIASVINRRIITSCMVTMSALSVLVILIVELALAAAMIASVINDTHPLIFACGVSSIVIAVLFFISLRVLSMELAEYRRDTAMVLESTFSIESHHFSDWRTT